METAMKATVVYNRKDRLEQGKNGWDFVVQVRRRDIGVFPATLKAQEAVYGLGSNNRPAWCKALLFPNVQFFFRLDEERMISLLRESIKNLKICSS